MKFLELLFGVFTFILTFLFLYSFDIKAKESKTSEDLIDQNLCIAIDKVQTTCWNRKDYRDFCKRLDACK